MIRCDRGTLSLRTGRETTFTSFLSHFADPMSHRQVKCFEHNQQVLNCPMLHSNMNFPKQQARQPMQSSQPWLPATLFASSNLVELKQRPPQDAACTIHTSRACPPTSPHPGSTQLAHHIQLHGTHRLVVRLQYGRQLKIVCA